MLMNLWPHIYHYSGFIKIKINVILLILKQGIIYTPYAFLTIFMTFWKIFDEILETFVKFFENFGIKVILSGRIHLPVF